MFDGHSASAAEKSAIASAYLRRRTAAADRHGPTAVLEYPLEYLGPRAHAAVPDRRAQSRPRRGERVGLGGLSPASVAQRVPAVVQKDGVARLARHCLQSRRSRMGRSRLGRSHMGRSHMGRSHYYYCVAWNAATRTQRNTRGCKRATYAEADGTRRFSAALASSKSAIAAECRPTLSCTSARELYLTKQRHAPTQMRARV